MAITFVKIAQGTIQVLGLDFDNEGDVNSIDAATAGGLFADTAIPKVGDLIRFAGNWEPSVKRAGKDYPRNVLFDGGTYVFGVSNGIAEYTVLTVAGNGALTVQRGST